jgi:hypothetical protein
MMHERRSAVGVVRVGVLNQRSETPSGERSIPTYPEHGHELDATRDGADARGQPISDERHSSTLSNLLLRQRSNSARRVERCATLGVVRAVLGETDVAASLDDG